MEFDPSKALRRETDASGHPIYIYLCIDCSKEIRIRHLKRGSGKCRSCCQVKYSLEEVRYKSLLSAASSKNHIVDISLQDYIELSKTGCHYCGDKIEFSLIRRDRRYYIDRKDNHVGYTKDNSVLACTTCNYFKKDMGYETFINLCSKIVAHNQTIKEIT